MNKSAAEVLKKNPAKVIGLKQVLRAIDEGAIGCVIVAEDCDEAYNEKVLRAVKGKGIEFLTVGSKTELGNLCAIDVACGIVGLLS
jgi:large subunit ribosomal protein L7A